MPRKYDTTKPKTTTQVNVDKAEWYKFKLIIDRMGIDKNSGMEKAIVLFNEKHKGKI